MLYLLAVLIGIFTGSRSLTPPAAVSWAADLGRIALAGSPLAFLGFRFVPILLTVLALGELYGDQHPKAPSRKKPGPFGARIINGGVCGGALGIAHGAFGIGIALGVVGAILGTLGGSVVRAKMAAAFGKDRPAAFIEDAVAIVGSLVVVALA